MRVSQTFHMRLSLFTGIRAMLLCKTCTTIPRSNQFIWQPLSVLSLTPKPGHRPFLEAEKNYSDPWKRKNFHNRWLAALLGAPPHHASKWIPKREGNLVKVPMATLMILCPSQLVQTENGLQLVRMEWNLWFLFGILLPLSDVVSYVFLGVPVPLQQ